MQVRCSICDERACDRSIKARSGKELTLWHCASCDFDFLAHDPSRDLAANKLDESRLQAAGLDIPTRERDFANGLAQSRPYVAEYLETSDRDAKVLEIGCSWGYFLKLVRDAGADPYGVELNTVRARYVSENLRIPCDVNLESCEARGIRFRKIFLFYVLEYVPEPVTYLQRLVDMLEQGGELVVVTPSLADPLKDLWRSESFRRFFYDEHAINYLTSRAVERMVAALRKRSAVIATRQGYSFVNHVGWFLTNAPRTTGVVGGDNFVREIVERLRPAGPIAEWDERRRALAGRLADLITNCDIEYRRVLEESGYGNQIRFVVTK
jgi:2-polyprenyl-3-methyl-5-hydroxy-6-metoxy-1,4-benzoquinol methylase